MYEPYFYQYYLVVSSSLRLDFNFIVTRSESPGCFLKDNFESGQAFIWNRFYTLTEQTTHS